MPESNSTVVGGDEMRPRHNVCDVQQNVAVVVDELLGEAQKEQAACYSRVVGMSCYNKLLQQAVVVYCRRRAANTAWRVYHTV